MSLPDLRTGRLLLRPVRPDDLAGIARQIGDIDVAKMLTTVPHPYAIEDAKAWFDQTAAQRRGGERAFAIDNGDGLVGVVSVGRSEGKPEFGYWLGKDHWGKGIMTEAGRAALAWHFGCFPELPVMSGALDENRASLNVLSKLGFSETGPYKLKILSRGQALPATRMTLNHAAFVENEKVPA
ncbi:MAG: GNAT family N-acetyltransferase [Roseibium sp.]|uniref:GNAT family N-acetyltransferase n=1 Tax=Roseibium sp. TaxID=1936156 RepID=UPI00260E48DE|nr:GNAT family N-acetyltransferase [Roseibium sp.]MCV0429886.1 GNAT family N-acetyltransferase [Roseibium sp.]